MVKLTSEEADWIRLLLVQHLNMLRTIAFKAEVQDAIDSLDRAIQESSEPQPKEN